MQIEQKQELVQALINFFEVQCDTAKEHFLLSNLAYVDLKTTEWDNTSLANTDVDVLMEAFDKLTDSSEKFAEILSLLQFELEADFDHIQLFNALKSFVGEDDVRLAQLERLFNIGTVH